MADRRAALRPAGWLGALQRHPVISVAAVAAVTRLAFAVVSFVVNRQYLIGDELQYVQLAHVVSHGRPAESWVAGYGQSLYDSSHVFMAQVTFLFRFVSDSRLSGQLVAVAWGAVAAAITCRLALELVRPRIALLAGLLIALLPSQVLWSSVVLRESLIWSGVAIIGLALAMVERQRGRTVVLWLAAIVAGLLGVAYLRQQTMVVAAWALALASVTAGISAFWRRIVPSIAAALVVPAVAGLGVFGWNLVTTAFPSLGATRTYMAMDAHSAFTPTTVLPSTTVPESTTTVPETTTTTVGSGALAIASRPGEKVVTPDGTTHLVIAGTGGKVYVTDEGLSANLHELPRGIVAVTLRPFPWEHGSGLALLLARLENVFWYPLYVVAAIGAWLGRRRLAVIAYPVLVTGGLVVSAALTQGNLGTAFRHRAQFLWALAVLAAVAVEHAVARREARRAGA